MTCASRLFSAATRVVTAALVATVILGLAIPPAKAMVAAGPLAQAYQNVLTAMRRPPTNGLLIISVELPARLARIGLQPADIITHIANQRIGGIAAFDAVLKTHSTARQPVPIIVVRAMRIEHFLATAATLQELKSVGVISVRAGAPAPLNPPATARAQLKLNWSRIPTIEPRGQEAVGQDTWMLVFYHQLVVGAIQLRVSHLGTTWKLLWNQESVANGPLLPMAWKIAFEPGDYQHSPALRMTTFTRWTRAGAIQGRYAGNTLYAAPLTPKITPTRAPACNSAANAAPLPLLALLASALPAHHGLVLPISDLAQQTLETRLGCVLTIGKQQEIHFAGANQRVRVVRMLWMDQPRYKFWISPHGGLLGINFGRGFSAYRVGGGMIIRRIIPKARLINVLPMNVTLKEH